MEKVFFFGLKIKAPWPSSLPFGRLLEEDNRHLTLAFLGKTHYSKLQEALKTFPQPNFTVGIAAKFVQCIFLPPQHPHVVAWKIEWMENSAPFFHFYEILLEWLRHQDISFSQHKEFLPHVTLARSPFNQEAWHKQFYPLPLFMYDICLYESIGHLKYVPLWTYPLLPPFEELDHTADLAFTIRGNTFEQLYQHAGLALAFTFPEMLTYLNCSESIDHLDTVIIALNQAIAAADQDIGCPFKAVSFHSHLKNHKQVMKWEMIIDV